MQKIQIELGKRSYPVYIGTVILDGFSRLYLSKGLPEHVAVITDRTVADLYFKPLVKGLQQYGCKVVKVIIPVGERQKTLSRASAIFASLLEAGFSRKSALVALGGGVVGDLGGFIAATFRRGVPLIQIPTTLIGQVESAIGGKVGVNHQNTKNAVGAFYQPTFVFSDIDFLQSLPRREIVCGFGELLKYAYLNREMYSFIHEHISDVFALDLGVLQEMIVRCNTMKAKMISEDEHELNPTGGRMVLNLGHTAGHAIEVLSNYRLHHGEAVMLGLRTELVLARHLQLLDAGAYAALGDLLQRVDFTPKENYYSPRTLVQYIFGKRDKQVFILPKNIGEIISIEVSRAAFESALKSKKAGS